MVFYFKARPEAGDYTIFMGLDKFENEELIKYGFPEDIWYTRFSLSLFARNSHTSKHKKELVSVDVNLMFAY